MNNKKQSIVIAIIGMLIVVTSTWSFSQESLYWITSEEREWLNDHPVITYAFDPEFAPFEYYDSEGISQGIIIESLALIERQLGIEIEIEYIGDWSQVVESLSDKHIDMISATPTEEREKYMNFSDIYLSIPTGMIVREGNTSIEKLEDLQGRTIATVKGWSWNEILAKDHPEYKIIVYDTVVDALNAVAYGDADATLQDYGTASYHISYNNITNLKVLGNYDTSLDLTFAVRKDYEPLVAILNKVIPRIEEEVDHIHDNWIKLEYDSVLNGTLFIQILGVITGILIVVLLWTVSLKSQVNRKTKALQSELERSKEMKMEIEEINLKLGRSERELRAILDTDPNSIFVKDREGKFVIVNEAATKVVGTTMDGMIGKTMRDFPKSMDEQTLDHMDKVESQLFSGMKKDDMYTVEIRIGQADLIHEVKKIPILGVDGRPEFILSVASDITDIHNKNVELENSIEKLKRAKAQLLEQEKWAAIGAFVAGIAHDVNTPLGSSITINSHMERLLKNSVIKLNSGTLKKSDLIEFHDDLEESISMIHRHLNHSAKLIQNFKAVSVNQINEVEEEFDICDYLRRISTGMKYECQKKGVSIQVNSKSNEILLNSAPGLISQIFTNLIANSLTHGFQSLNGGDISIETEQKGQSIQITYKDDGSGMDSETLENVFTPFFTTKQDEGGSGLGMHIVHTLITEKLGGTISATSELGKGVQFIIIIPNNN